MVNAALQYIRKWKKVQFTQELDSHVHEFSQPVSVYEEIGAKEITALVQN